MRSIIHWRVLILIFERSKCSRSTATNSSPCSRMRLIESLRPSSAIRDNSSTKYSACISRARICAIKSRPLSRVGGALPPIAEQLAKRRQLLTAELDSLQSIEAAARTLYDALSPEQKKLADAMLADHLRRM